MNYIEQINLKLEVTHCCVCGVTFAIPKLMLDQRRRNQDGFYCPNGHSLVFTGESTENKAKRLEKELKESRRWETYWEKTYKGEAEEHKATKRSLSATKAAHTRTKKRIANGVCPCCRRTFQNLQRHMATEHPDFEDEVTE